MRTRFIIFVFTLLLAGFTIGLQDLKEIPERITFEGERRGPVDFPHVLHHDAGLTCQTCHHTMPQEAERPEQGCRDCHTKESTISSMRAFHNTCITCHRNDNRDKGTTLPFKCNDCHAKQ